MKILFLTTHLNPGGITSYLLTLVKELKKAGHEVFVISAGGDCHKEFDAYCCVKELSILTKSEVSPRLYLALGPARQFIKENRIDVIHAQTRITQVMAALLSRSCGIPFVATCHGFFKPRLSRKLFPCWGQKTIAISEPVKQHLIEDFHVAKENIRVIPNGIDCEEFPLVDEERRRKVRKNFQLKDEIVVGHIARLSDVKGQDILIEAMERVCQEIPEAHLFIFGEGKWKEHLQQLVEKFGIAKKTHIFPKTHSTSELLALFDIYVMPSRQEGLGLAVLEAQASGLPVIASRIGGLPSIIEDGRTGLLVEPQNARALAEKIIELIPQHEFRIRLGQQAHVFVREKHNAVDMVAKTVELYESVVSS